MLFVIFVLCAKRRCGLWPQVLYTFLAPTTAQPSVAFGGGGGGGEYRYGCALVRRSGDMLTWRDGTRPNIGSGTLQDVACPRWA